MCTTSIPKRQRRLHVPPGSACLDLGDVVYPPQGRAPAAASVCLCPLRVYRFGDPIKLRRRHHCSVRQPRAPSVETRLLCLGARIVNVLLLVSTRKAAQIARNRPHFVRRRAARRRPSGVLHQKVQRIACGALLHAVDSGGGGAVGARAGLALGNARAVGGGAAIGLFPTKANAGVVKTRGGALCGAPRKFQGAAVVVITETEFDHLAVRDVRIVATAPSAGKGRVARRCTSIPVGRGAVGLSRLARGVALRCVVEFVLGHLGNATLVDKRICVARLPGGRRRQEEERHGDECVCAPLVEEARNGNMTRHTS